jgi:Sec-independent protein secretion pathway component TatC
VFSQLMLAAPLIALYEVGVLAARVVVRSHHDKKDNIERNSLD